MPIEPQILGHFRDRCATALFADIERDLTPVVRMLPEPVKTSLLDATARAARDTPHGDLQSYVQIAARQIANVSHSLIVPHPVDRATASAGRIVLAAMQGDHHRTGILDRAARRKAWKPMRVPQLTY